jgi:hypothetical protein
MVEKIIDAPSGHKLNRIFSREASEGLYFERDWRLGLKIKSPEVEPSYVCYDVNEASTKRCELFVGDEIIKFDNFQPKNNLKYYIFSRGQRHFIYYIDDQLQSYSDCRKLALELAKQGKEVLISEVFCKLKRIAHADKVAVHPFELSPTKKDIFFWHSRNNTFSNLISAEEEKALDMEDLISWQPMGQSNLSIFRRLAYYRLGELTKFSAPSGEHAFSVVSKLGVSDSFDTYVKAIEYCKEQNKKGEAGCEYIICENLDSMSWH